MMVRPVADIMIVGSGTAGWLAACLIAARTGSGCAHPISVTLVESPDAPSIGVGEGTWPTTRYTLEPIGISETQFAVARDASFKQASRFDGWRTRTADESYLHPFTTALDGDAREVVHAWAEDDRRFADAVCVQSEICRWDLTPRQREMPDYSDSLDYAYHLEPASSPRC